MHMQIFIGNSYPEDGWFICDTASFLNATQGVVFIWFVNYWVHVHASATDDSCWNAFKKWVFGQSVCIEVYGKWIGTIITLSSWDT